MSITDELRAWAKGQTLSSWMAEHLTAIADRIDAEHEAACAEAYGSGVQSVALPDMTAYAKLPKDADGEYIHIGDVMEWPEDGETFEVVGIGDDWTLFYVIEDGVAEWTRAENKRHHQPDTWERIIEDALDGYHDTDFDKLVARCRALAGDAS